MYATTQPGTVLIVDDDAAHRATLSRYLSGKGFTVHEAAGGAQALDQLGRERIDIVLLDLLMPHMDGFQTLEAIRQQRSMTELPIVMATALDDTADVVAALRLGANDYVTKPFNLPIVLARVRTQLTLKRSVEQITRLEKDRRRSLEAAAHVQRTLLPQGSPRIAGARFAWQFRPCVELAGDLLNVVALDGQRVALYVLDVVGHGPKAALLAVMVSRALGLLLASGQDDRSPAVVAERLNREFPWNDSTEQFLTLLYGVLEVPTGEFRFVSAGHPMPLHLTAEGVRRGRESSGQPIGLGQDYREIRLTLQPEERLYLYTDGLVETKNAERVQFGVERVSAALTRSRTVSLDDGLTALLGEVDDWCHPAIPADDITILAVERV